MYVCLSEWVCVCVACCLFRSDASLSTRAHTHTATHTRILTWYGNWKEFFEKKKNKNEIKIDLNMIKRKIKDQLKSIKAKRRFTWILDSIQRLSLPREYWKCCCDLAPRTGSVRLNQLTLVILAVSMLPTKFYRNRFTVLLFFYRSTVLPFTKKKKKNTFWYRSQVLLESLTNKWITWRKKNKKNEEEITKTHDNGQIYIDRPDKHMYCCSCIQFNSIESIHDECANAVQYLRPQICTLRCSTS